MRCTATVCVRSSCCTMRPSIYGVICSVSFSSQVWVSTLSLWVNHLCVGLERNLTRYFFQHHFPDATTADSAIFLTFCIAALKCLFCSSFYHTYICHHKIKGFAATLDYIGISFLIAASVLVTEYYGFYCQDTIRNRYMVFTAFVSSFGVITPFFKFWDTREFRPFRIAIFLALAFSSVVPVLHLVKLQGFWKTWDFLFPAMISVCQYLLGVLFCKCPCIRNVFGTDFWLRTCRRQPVPWESISGTLWFRWYD